LSPRTRADAAAARALAGEALDLCERLGFAAVAMHARHVLGLVDLAEGDQDGAAAELLPLMRRLDEAGL
jgi:hypothetical protein